MAKNFNLRCTHTMATARKKVRLVSTGTNKNGKPTGTFVVITVHKLAPEKLRIRSVSTEELSTQKQVSAVCMLSL